MGQKMVKTSNQNIVFRPATKKDVPIILEMQSKGIPDVGVPIDAAYLNDIIKHGFIFVAEGNEQIIGFICGEFLVHYGAAIWYHMVDKKHRGRGIGTLLLDYCEQFLRDGGIEWFTAQVKDPAVVAFHKKRGAAIGESYTEIIRDF